ncbi:MAG: tetratricopeptide repeat protein [Crocinitomicaceae bacterium]
MKRILIVLLFSITKPIGFADYAFAQKPYDHSFYLIDSTAFSFMEGDDAILIDSTLEKYHVTNNDTLRLNLLNHIVENSYNDWIWPAYNEILKKESERLLGDTRMSNAIWSNKIVSMYALAINNQGYLDYYRGNIQNALEKYQQSLKIKEQIKDSVGIAQALNNIGGVFYSTGNYEKSITYFKKSLHIKKSVAEPKVIATTLSNIGSIYNILDELDSAEHYFNESLAISQKDKNKESLALSYHNLGSLHSKRGDTELAHLFFLKSIRLSEALNDYNMVAGSYLLLAKMEVEKGELIQAEIYAKRALALVKELGFPAEIGDASEVLLKVYREKGEYKKALEMYDQYISMKDSVMSTQIKNDLENQQITYEYEKKALADSLKYVEENRVNIAMIAEQEARIEKNQILTYSLIIGFLLLLVISIIIFIALKNIRKAKEIIADQKVEVEKQHHLTEQQREKLAAKNEEILDSINYAKRLQEGMLPAEETRKQLLPNSFVLYLPKDIVAGDFYWMDKIEDTVYFAVADCTGHGVPGAFVSIICANAMDHAMLELNKPSPAQILEQVTQSVIQAFEKSDHQIKDGMDIALCALNTKTLELQFSGAYNPLWIVTDRSTVSGTTSPYTIDEKIYLHEIKGTKQPVGKYSFKKDFEQHTIQLTSGDQIYLTSDGYPDQFGGDKGKKLKYKNFKHLILTYSHLQGQDQKQQLSKYFKDWKKDFEQLDDVCVIGVRL